MSPAPKTASNCIKLHQTVSEPRFERAWFTYRGRQWRIYKRGSGPLARWYLYFEHQGRRVNHCCGEVERRAAIETARLKIDAVLDGHKDTLRQSMMRPAVPERCCSVGEIIAGYERLDVAAKEITKRGAVNCLRLVLRSALGVESVDSLGGEVLSEETGLRFFESQMRKARRESSQVEQARVMRSANSIFNQARCVVLEWVMKRLQQQGLRVPEVEGFRSAYRLRKFKKVGVVYNPPARELIRRTLHEWLKLPRNEFLAVGLELACGLRKGELAQVSWGMWGEKGGLAVLEGEASVKDGGGRIEVVPLDPFWRVLNRRVEREGWRGEPDDLVLQGGATELRDGVFRSVGAWLRGLGWETQKTNHALRAYSGGLVCVKYDVYRASRWLRHASVTTTERHYKHFVDGIEEGARERVRVRWAKGKAKG